MTATEQLAVGSNDLVGFAVPNGRSVVIKPAHRSNYSTMQSNPYGAAKRQQVAICYHTPEEPVDNNEVTPAWFQDPRANASTGYYADSDGDIYQMVADADYAWAQGVRFEGDRANAVTPVPGWFDRAEMVSYNTCMISIEIEGYAADHERTFHRGTAQWDTVVAWSAFVCKKYGIPVDRDHHVAHSRLCTWKTDPNWLEATWSQLLADIARTAHPVRIDVPADLAGRVSRLEAWADSFRKVD